VIHPWTMLIGPLAGPECARASSRGWVIWVRLVPGLASGLVAFVALWVWWMNQKIDPYYLPGWEVDLGLAVIEGLMVAIALILTPAVLAGSLAGEKERGSIGLLLTTRVNSAEIVLGRLAGRLSQVALIELSAVPGLLLFASLGGFDWASSAMLVALPGAVALGAGGLALAASSLSRRGRDALLLAYLVIVLALMSPLLERPGWPQVGLINPFERMIEHLQGGSIAPALTTSAIWASLGLACLALASWRLRPCALGVGNDPKPRKARRWRGWVPPIDERPMLWKELYIERAGTLGRAGRWIGWLLVAWLGLGSLALATVAQWGDLLGPSLEWRGWAWGLLSGVMYGGSALYIGFLIQWTIGLRAAVAIASERERGTWDALLTSPLEGGEIVRGKLWGSLHALRWLIASAAIAWTVAVLHGGLLTLEYGERMVELPIIGAFMAAVGVRTSLRSATATRAMSVTIGLWLAGTIAAKATAWLVCLLVALICVVSWIFAIQLGFVDFNSKPWFPMRFRVGNDLVFYSCFLAATIAIVAETRLRFDRIAGRMAGDSTAIAVDRFFEPRFVGPLAGSKAAKLPEPSEV